MNTKKEVWKDVAGYCGYKISNLGRVKSNRRKGVPWKILKPFERGSMRYNSVCFRPEGHYVLVRNLVAKTFIGPPKNRHVVVNLDGNPRNDRADNIQYLPRRLSHIRGRHRGVYRCHMNPLRETWVARLMLVGKSRWLGRFDSEKDALTARKNLIDSILNDTTPRKET